MRDTTADRMTLWDRPRGSRLARLPHARIRGYVEPARSLPTRQHVRTPDRGSAPAHSRTATGGPREGRGLSTGTRRGEEPAEERRRHRSPTCSPQGQQNEVIGKMRVIDLLQSMPGLGKVRARQTMERLGIAESRRVRGLGTKQVAALEGVRCLTLGPPALIELVEMSARRLPAHLRWSRQLDQRGRPTSHARVTEPERTAVSSSWPARPPSARAASRPTSASTTPRSGSRSPRPPGSRARAR